MDSCLEEYKASEELDDGLTFNIPADIPIPQAETSNPTVLEETSDEGNPQDGYESMAEGSGLIGDNHPLVLEATQDSGPEGRGAPKPTMRESRNTFSPLFTFFAGAEVPGGPLLLIQQLLGWLVRSM